MKKTLMMVLVSLMMMFFAGVALAGSEDYSNTFYGEQAGVSTTYNGLNDTFIGFHTGYSNTGACNTFVGSVAGGDNLTGSNNTFIGTWAGRYHQTGDNNTILGQSAGVYNISGNDNTFLGNGAGYLTTGSGNVFLGFLAGRNETGSNKLYIANSDTPTPLIYGEFDNNILSTPGSFGIGTQAPVRQLHLAGSNAVFRMDRTSDTAAFMLVRTDASGNPQKTFVVGTNYNSFENRGEFVINDLGTEIGGPGNRRMTIANDGSVTFTGNVYANSFTPSSMTYKDNVRTYDNALETVNKLRGVRFDWKDSGQPSVGLIAEEVEQVVPEVVAHNDGNVTGVNYASLVGVLVEAFKEQEAKHQAELKAQLRINEEQQRINNALAEKVSQLERLMTSR